MTNISQETKEEIDYTKYYDDDGYPHDIGDNYALQLGYSIYTNNLDYFLKLLSPSFFIELDRTDKFKQAIMSIFITITKKNEANKKKKFYKNLLFNPNMDENLLEELESYLEDTGYSIDDVLKNISKRKFIELNKELPINNTKEKKKTKV